MTVGRNSKLDYHLRKTVGIDKKPFTQGLHWPDKDLEARGVVTSLFESMEANGEETFNSPEIYKPDPPDCIAKDKNGNDVGFEVTALIDRDEVRRNVKGESVYRDWTAKEVIQEIQKIIDKKDKNIFHGGPYSKKIVVLHTHNLIIQSDCKETIENHLFNPLKQIDEAYILFYYDAAIKRYPYIKLNFKAP